MGETHFLFFLPEPGEKPGEPSLGVLDDRALKLVFLGILADDKHFYGMYDFMCMAEEPQTQEEDPETTEGKTAYLERIKGTAIYRKKQGTLKTLRATGPFVGLLERLGLEEK